MLVRTLACARTGRSAGKVMIANRFLGNPTDRDENGGLRNRRCHGSRTEAPRETEGIATVPYRACAPQFYPNNLRLLRPERRGTQYQSSHHNMPQAEKGNRDIGGIVFKTSRFPTRLAPRACQGIGNVYTMAIHRI